MKKRVFALLLGALLLSGCGGQAGPGYRQVSQEEAMRMMEEETDYILLDVRTREEYDEAHIAGAVCVPNESIGSDPIPELPDKDQLILVYCRSGNRSQQASQKLADLGYTNIVEFGGINTWTGAVMTGADSALPVLQLDNASETEAGGIHLLVTGYSDPIITAVLSNRSGKTWSYGAPFSLLRKEADGSWKELEWPDSIMWIQIAYELADGEDAEIRCDVTGLGSLDAGEYKLCKGELAAPFDLRWSE